MEASKYPVGWIDRSRCITRKSFSTISKWCICIDEGQCISYLARVCESARSRRASHNGCAFVFGVRKHHCFVSVPNTCGSSRRIQNSQYCSIGSICEGYFYFTIQDNMLCIKLCPEVEVFWLGSYVGYVRII